MQNLTQKIEERSSQRGFTIVELLIVIVVIAILAAITIVAYNGIQTRAKNTSAASAAENMAKKIEGYNSVTGAYPVMNTTNNVTTQLATQNESSLTGSGLAIGTPTAANGSGTVAVQLCGSTAPTNGVTATGYKVFRWDYSTNALQTTPDQSGGVTTACTANQTS